MYRSCPESSKKQNTEAFRNLLGCNRLDMKCWQEMYLDTGYPLAASTPSPSISPQSPSSSAENGPLFSPIFMSSNSSLHSTDSEVDMTVDNLAALQQQQFLVAHQQHLAAAAMAKHQFAAADNQLNMPSCPVPSQDDISKSLKMFAMLTAYSNGTDPSAIPSQTQNSPVDTVMQDFACNGYICDDPNRFQLGRYLSNVTATENGNSNIHHNATNSHYQFGNGMTPHNNAAATNSTLNTQQLNALQQQNFSINFNNNFWKMLPTHVQQEPNAVTAAAAAAAAATAAAAVNIDYNCNRKKLSKRCNQSKNEKYLSVKHCVFCENNNEPEDVVKSHSVRDALGRVLCPKLRIYVCPICKASGDFAHTVKYCPEKPIITMEDALKAQSFRLAKNAFY